MLIELLRPAGPELARRWLAALMLVDAEEREAMVEMVERQVAQLYGARAAAAAGGFQVVHPPVQRDGHTEQLITTYEVVGQDDAGREEQGHARHLRRAR